MNRKAYSKKCQITGFIILLLSAVFLMFPGTAAAAKKSDTNFCKSLSKMVRQNPPKYTNGMQSSGPYATMRLIVKTKNKKVDLRKYGAKSIISGMDNISIMQFSSIDAAKKAEKKIKKLKNVVYVEPDRVISAAAGSENSEDTELSWGVSETGLGDFSRYVGTLTTDTITVAVVDTGVAKHTKLNARLLKGVDALYGKTTKDKDGHGTHVAGIIVDSTPGANVKILPVRVGDRKEIIYQSELAVGIWYAVQKGAKVINLSIGNEGRMRFVEDQINAALKVDCVVVVAAGNENADINSHKFSPALMKNVITVGAVNSKKKRWVEFSQGSNYGKSLDVVAPGVNIRSTWLYDSMYTQGGTSMAAPHVAALAALYRLLYPEKNAEQIKQLITGCTVDLGKKGWDKYYGYGLIQAPTQYTKLDLGVSDMTLAPGDSRRLKYTIKNDYLTKGNVVWNSSNPDVATIKDGMVTGLKEGGAVISVTAYGKTASCTVLVDKNAAREDAMKTYAKALTNDKILYQTGSYSAYFSLINLDNNDIPELVVGDYPENCNSFTLLGVNGKILDVYELFDISTENQSISAYYFPRTGVLYSTTQEDPGETGKGIKYITDYQYAWLSEGDRLLISPDFPLSKSEMHYENGTIAITYTEQTETDTTISEESFQTALKKYTGGAASVKIRLYNNIAENRKRYLGY